MSLFGAVLILFSTVLHALWQIVTKRVNGTIAFFFLVNFFAALVLLPFGAGAALYTGAMKGLWGYCALSGLFLALYFGALGNAYKRGDVSVIYPLVRAVPVVAVAAIKFFGGEIITPPAVAGILIIASGCILLGLEPQGANSAARGDRRRLDPSLAVMALLITVGTVGYTIVDKAAMDHVEGGMRAFVYVYWETAAAALFMLPLSLLGRERKSLSLFARRFWKPVVTVSFLVVLSYGLVLWAYQSCKVSYAAAFRQLSIVPGVIVSGLYLKEKNTRKRLIVAMIILAGIVLVGLADDIWAVPEGTG